MISEWLSYHIYSKSLPNHNWTSHSPRLDLESSHSLHFHPRTQTFISKNSWPNLNHSSKFLLIWTHIIILSICFGSLEEEMIGISTVQYHINDGEFEFWALEATSIEASTSIHLLHPSSVAVFTIWALKALQSRLPYPSKWKFETHVLFNICMR